jgi:hypothetical protein
MGKKPVTFGEAWREQSLESYDREAATAAQPMTGDELRAAIDRWNTPYGNAPYNRVAGWLGLSVDGLHKQMRGERPVSTQTKLLFRRIDQWISHDIWTADEADLPDSKRLRWKLRAKAVRDAA